MGNMLSSISVLYAPDYKARCFVFCFVFIKHSEHNPIFTNGEKFLKNVMQRFVGKQTFVSCVACQNFCICNNMDVKYFQSSKHYSFKINVNFCDVLFR
jgi:hypothetical protein